MRTIALAICLFVCSSLPAAAYTMARPLVQTGALVSTGYYGGVVKSATFRLIRSKQGGVYFYRISLPFYVTYRYKSISISELPLHTPVTVTTRDGRVVAVEVTGS